MPKGTVRVGASPAGAGMHVALLRGVNVAGKNLLPMPDLAAMFTDFGCTEVVTYIQSGNVVFGAPATLAERIPGLVSKGIAARFGFDVPIVMRTLAELTAVIRTNPFLDRQAEHRSDKSPEPLHVLFLAHPPTAQAIAGLEPNRSPPDEFAVRGREIFLWCPNGVGRSKLTNDYFDRKLATTCTSRNWRTVQKLILLMS